MPPEIDRKWPKQREPSPIAGQNFPTQQPIVGVFGQEGFGEQFSVNSPLVLAAQQTMVEETRIIEQPELHRITIEEDPEILAAEMLLKADREATDWKPITFTFDGINPQQVGRMVGRVAILFFNGTGPVTIARKQADLSSLSNENWTLATGASSSINTEGEFWLTAANGTKLSVIQTFWDLEGLVVAKKRSKNAHYNGTPRSWQGTKASSNAN